ncbi:Ketopantoate hydroxymethyltransferase [Hartmannibacter diazotrophicus]|uniref:Ketopantoate hydroxymethyltransferase n=1 Tax=Hartmannibacter diazotrophicus TaxID=1482074 RepID=A0A2C9D8H9_9HYPH|nr:small ribosomal subunit Rsm22 family protein [Hartmannibacter diazotrophicus]SON56438.1 Ketopantoate hydroxymethyltransferase [Hartmannibacter diazotrophicus]
MTDLPPALRAVVETSADGIALETLATAAERLSERYRGEVRDGRYHLSSDLAARAYLASRLPATYAAVSASLAMADARLDDFQPTSILDIGAGPGTATLAAAGVWPSLASAVLAEGSADIAQWGARLLATVKGLQSHWLKADILGGLSGVEKADLVTMAYVLDEVAPSARAALIAQAYNLSRELLVIVEPGTPAGWRRIVEARGQLLASGAHVVAPCMHSLECPLTEPDWCHFAQRLARSRLHRQVKRAEVPYEDEKYIFLAVARSPELLRPVSVSRILAPPDAGKGRIGLKLCRPDGTVANVIVSRRDGEAFKAARRADWGDTFERGDSAAG